MEDILCSAAAPDDQDGREDFRFSLVAADGSVVGECHSEKALAPGDLVTVQTTREVWCVESTLGSIARVRPPANGEAAVVRVSASTAAGARALAAELAAGAYCAETPNGWVVYAPVSDAGRVATLTVVAAAARRAEAAESSVEFFLLDHGRRFRVPPSV
jgi:hypothetical protein